MTAGIGAKRARASPLEHDEQVRVVNWARVQQIRRPELALLHATPNGGDRHPVVAAKLKAEGVSKGFPDLSLHVPRGNFAALHIEMKRASATPSDTSAEQHRWIELLNRYGCYAVVRCGADQAIQTITDYLDGRIALDDDAEGA